MTKKTEEWNQPTSNASGFEFQCDKCNEFTSLGHTCPKDGAKVTCKHCGAKYGG